MSLHVQNALACRPNDPQAQNIPFLYANKKQKTMKIGYGYTTRITHPKSSITLLNECKAGLILLVVSSLMAGRYYLIYLTMEYLLFRNAFWYQKLLFTPLIKIQKGCDQLLLIHHKEQVLLS
jgi:hypothetical protein